MDGEARPLSAAALRASRGVALRAECGNDEAFVFTLFVEARAPGFANIPLEPAQRDALLRQQFTLQTTQYRRSFPAASFSIVEWGAASIGRLYVDRLAPSMHVIDVALLRAWQGRGIGSRLLGELQEEARVAGRAVSLHVERASPAQSLYLRLGFRVLRDKGVYLEMEWRPAPGGRAA
mgnify:FL=1